MNNFSVKTRLIFAICFLMQTVFIFGVEISAQTSGIKISLVRVENYRIENGAEIADDKETAADGFIETGGAEENRPNFMLLQGRFAPKEKFRLQIQNQTDLDWQIHIHKFTVESGNCTAIIPNREESKNMGSLPLLAGERKNMFLTEDEKGGTEQFAVFVTRGGDIYEDLFKQFGQMAFFGGNSNARASIKLGVSQGRAAVTTDQGISKGKPQQSGNRAEFDITANLGGIYNPKGEKNQPTEYYDSLLKIGQCSSKNNDASYRELKMIWLNNRGLTHYEKSRFSEALKDYNESLSIIENISYGQRWNAERAAVLSNRGQVFSSLKKYAEALKDFDDALKLLEEKTSNGEDSAATNPFASRAIILNNKAVVYEQQRDFKQAEKFYNDALKLEEEKDLKLNKAVTLNNLGRMSLALGKFDEAVKNLLLAEELSKTLNLSSNLGSIYNSLGTVYFSRKDYENSGIYFSKSAAILLQSGNRAGLGATLTNLMFLAKQSGNPRLAVFYGKQAVNIFQQIRSEITGLDLASQKGFLNPREEVYRVLADLLFEQGRIFEGQEVLAMLKQEEYAQFVRRGSDEIKNLLKTAELNDVEKDVYPEFVKIADELTNKGRLFDEMRKNPNRDEAEFQKLKTEIETANIALREFFNRLKSEFTKKVEDDAVITPESIETLRAKLRGAGKDVVMITYFLQTDYFRVIVTTGQTHAVHKIEYKQFNLTGADVNRKIAQFIGVLQTPTQDPRPQAEELYKIFFAPIEKDITQAGGKILLWSLDGSLRYIPTAALYDGKQYLAERFKNAVVTLGRTTDIFDDPKPNWRVLGFGVSEKHGEFSELPAVRRELDSIVNDETANAQGVLPGRKMLNADFNLSNFQLFLPAETDDGQKFNILHLATHFRLGSDNKISAILLGDGTELSLEKLSQDEQLGFENLELLTLSACETAVPVDTGDGREVESLGLLAQKKGAKAVLATLWKVADCSTGEFMRGFYNSHKLDTKISKAESIQAVQKAMINGTIKESADCQLRSGVKGTNKTKTNAPPFVFDESKPFAHPYFWSPFVLIGNWR